LLLLLQAHTNDTSRTCLLLALCLRCCTIPDSQLLLLLLLLL
jgi:hypothetical protein